MPTYLDLIQLELSQITEQDLIKPTSQARPCEHEVGVLPVDLRKLCTLNEQMKRQLRHMVEDFEMATNSFSRLPKAVLDEKRQELRVFSDKCDVVERLYVISVCEAFRIWDQTFFIIHAGWRVAFCDHFHVDDNRVIISIE